MGGFFLEEKGDFGGEKKEDLGVGRETLEGNPGFISWKRGDFVAKKRFWGQKRRFWGFPTDPPGREWGERKDAKIGIKG